MAATTTTKKQPKFEWAEKAGTYVLRLSLAGFRKDDFRVQVDGAGRLTVRGARPAAAGLGSFHKVFQLPSAASLDDIAGRFEAGVLTLTMPKRASATAAPTSIEELKRKPSVAKVEDGATDGVEKGDASEAKEEVPKEEALRKDTEEATEKAQEKKPEEEEEDVNKSRKQEQQKQAPAPMKQEETVKPKAPQGEAAGQTPMKPAPNPEVATGGDKAKAAVVPETESLAERVRQQRGEATTAASATEAKAELEKKVTAWCSGNWKERMHGELKVLTDMKWADSLVEAARNNKEVVAIGIAAFSLRLLVSHKLFRK